VKEINYRILAPSALDGAGGLTPGNRGITHAAFTHSGEEEKGVCY